MCAYIANYSTINPMFYTTKLLFQCKFGCAHLLLHGLSPLLELEIHVHVPTCIQSTCHFFHFLFLVDFHRTIPADGIACPGEKLQYMCTSSKSQLSWTVGNSQPVTIGGNMVVNSSKNIDHFSLLLSAKNATNISSTATIDMVTSTYDGEQIACYSGTEIDSDDIDIAGTVVTTLNSNVVFEFLLSGFA